MFLIEEKIIMELEELFCIIDDFYLGFQKSINFKLLENNQRKTRKISRLSSYRNFKAYYQEKIMKYHQKDFSCLVSYNRFVELIPYTLILDFGQKKKNRLA
jgi:hypothetical protein